MSGDEQSGRRSVRDELPGDEVSRGQNVWSRSKSRFYESILFIMIILSTNSKFFQINDIFYFVFLTNFLQEFYIYIYISYRFLFSGVFSRALYVSYSTYP